jgi:hypothetical protein
MTLSVLFLETEPSVLIGYESGVSRVSLANRKIIAYAGTKIWLSGID